MIKKPRLKNSFRCEQVDSEGIFLLSETETTFLSNPLFQKLIPLIDGKLTEEEIVDQLCKELPESYIYYALMDLEQKGLIVENERVLDPNFALFCESLLVDAQDAHKQLQAIRVELRALGALSCKKLSDSLERSHIQVVDNGEIEVVLTDDYLRGELGAINRANLEKSRPWMLIKPVGTLLWIGPIFRPGKLDVGNV
ncbi:MAG: hypothetical protein HC772_15695 [Leptolyngbyaceae cyanobacterium CRU_2_3]|nr:hypothetical protein [Leptolyngbyaceae cyanobacterium CRU_2_3]